MSFFGDILGFGTDIAGLSLAHHESKANRSSAEAQFNEQMDHSIERRVKDGLRAGINPLAAIGASVNSTPTIHTAGGDSNSGAFLSKMGDRLSKMFESKTENDIRYEKQAQDLDLESKRLENRILRQRLSDVSHNVSKGAAKEVPDEQPTRLGDKPIFSIAYDLKDRPRLIVNQDVLEGDSDNAGYSASLLPLIADGRISKTTGQINSDQVRMMLDDMYYNMTGRHIQNLSELYISPTEVALATGNAADQSGFHPIKWVKRKLGFGKQ